MWVWSVECKCFLDLLQEVGLILVLCKSERSIFVESVYLEL